MVYVINLLLSSFTSSCSTCTINRHPTLLTMSVSLGYTSANLLASLACIRRLCHLPAFLVTLLTSSRGFQSNATLPGTKLWHCDGSIVLVQYVVIFQIRLILRRGFTVTVFRCIKFPRQYRGYIQYHLHLLYHLLFFDVCDFILIAMVCFRLSIVTGIVFFKILISGLTCNKYARY